jgi:hypothetical protein
MSQPQRHDGIFISYRREETAANARLLYSRLSEHFGTNRVFMDVDSIAIGADFTRELTEAVSQCKVLLVLIGRNWSSITDSRGKRRIDNPGDWIRIEIETALQRGIAVVPVLVDGAALPQASDLPSSLRPLTQRQALELRHTQFKSDSQRLVKEIGRIFGVRGILESKISAPGPAASAALVGGAIYVIGKAIIRGVLSGRR